MANRFRFARCVGLASLLLFGISACKQPEKIAASEPATVHDERGQSHPSTKWRTKVTKSLNERFTLHEKLKPKYWIDGLEACLFDGSSQAWCRDIPYMFYSVMVMDSGLVVAEGVRCVNERDTSKPPEEFVLAVFEPNGTSRIATRPITPRGGIFDPPIPDFPTVIRLQVDEQRDLIMMWVEDAPDGLYGSTCGWVGIPMMYLSRLSNPEQQKKIDLRSFGMLEDSLIIRDTPLIATYVARRERDGKLKEHKLVVVDPERGPIWTHELNDEIVAFPSSDAPKPLIYFIAYRDQQPTVWVRSPQPGMFQVKQKDESMLTFTVTMGEDQSWTVSQLHPL